MGRRSNYETWSRFTPEIESNAQSIGQTHRTKVKDMEQFIDLLIFLIIIGSAILIHEWGHFMIGRRLGIKMLEFGFGMPPRLLKLGQWRETEITLNWIPLGGFVRPEGMYDADKTDGLVTAHPQGFLKR